jgi:lysophospholipase L1-like esterase
MAYALKYLAVHRHTKLVTINIGANDAFLCQETTADHCTSPAELLALVNKIQANLTTIYTQIRDTAHYQGLHARREPSRRSSALAPAVYPELMYSSAGWAC